MNHKYTFFHQEDAVLPYIMPPSEGVPPDAYLISIVIDQTLGFNLEFSLQF